MPLLQTGVKGYARGRSHWDSRGIWSLRPPGSGLLGEAHLRRILAAYAAYYNVSRTHRSLDKDARRVRAMGIRDKPIAFGSPWQNCFAERLIESSSDPELRHHTNLVRIASSLRADMIFGKDNF